MFHILYVDDEPYLLEIGKLYLEQGGQFTVDTITSAKEALRILDNKGYDAIIADYQMPDINGIEFLKQVRASNKTIPFILFTGRGREEVVIQALNEGADFYLQKGGEPQSQYAELANKVRYAVMRRRAEDSLKQNEAQLRQIIDLVPHRIFVKDKNGNFLLANKAVAQEYGTDVNTIVGKSQALYEPDTSRLLRIYEDDREVITTGVSKFIEEDPLIDSSGNQLFFQTTKVPFTTVGNEEPAVLGVSINITQRRLVEKALRESEERYRRIVETTDEGIFQLDSDLRITYVNRKMAEMHGCTPDEMVGKCMLQFILPEDVEENLVRSQERRQGKVGRYERRYFTKDKMIGWMQVSATPLMDPDGTYRGSFAMCSDITDRKNAEAEIIRKNEDLHAAYEQMSAGEEELRRNYAELAKSRSLLEESEQRYRNVVEDQTEFISRFLPDGTHVFVNEAYCRYFHKNRDEIVGHRFRPNIPREDRALLEQFFLSLTPDHPIDSIEHRIVMPDGTIRWQWWSDRAIFDASGNLTHYQSVGRDVTEEKATATAWKESEIRFREQYQNNPLAILTLQHNEDGRFVFIDCNRAARDLTQGRANDFIGQSISDLLPFGSEFVSRIRDCFSHRNVISTELVSECFLPGRLIYATAAFVPPDLVMIHLDDITDEKMAEEALRESQRTLAESMDLANLVTWECDISSGILTFDNRGSSLYGETLQQNGINQMTAEEYLQKVVHPDDLPILLEEDQKTRTTTDPDYTSKREYRIIRADDEVRYIEMCVGVTKDAAGRTIKTHGVNQDITERKKAQEALRDSEEKFRSVVENSTDIIYSTKPDGIITYISPKLAELTGYDTKTVVGKSLESVLATDEMSHHSRELLKTLWSGEKVSGVECRIQHRDGSWHWHSATASPVRDTGGKIISVVGSIRDITERKKTEVALRRANRQLGLLSGITRHDVLNKLTGVLGYLKLAEIYAANPRINVYLEKIETLVTEMQSQIEFSRIYQELGSHDADWIDLDSVMPRSRIPSPITLNADVGNVKVFADPMLEKIFSNLLDNAIRHGVHVTEITVSAKLSGKDLVIIWEDNGEGISEHEKERIFEQGYGKNTGLGLFLSREILSLTGITIRETGTPGQGARFEITVPKGQFQGKSLP